HILVEEPLTVGDYIELAESQKGTVIDIGWRTTRILTAGNTVVVIPNQKITSGILTNHSLPQPRVTAEIAIFAAHSADPDRIAEIALAAAASTTGVLDNPSPVVVFDPGVLATHLQMKLIVQAADVEARGRVQSEIRKRIYDGMRQENLPFPEVRPAP
ncbi:MAG TPA: mechanosensitive ion channel domain-containing protein, partial [Bryobacteraceae bacterium]|nr:mechanosensitive ion channel domain-containing protein [Bryobacteraceae bacterium]